MHKRLALLFAILILLAVAGSAFAMTSPHYQLDRFALVSGGGNSTSSTNYMANYTVGQTAIATSSDAANVVGLGYWQDLRIGYQVYIPVVEK